MIDSVDPLEVLTTPDEPIWPRDRFVTELRTRLAAELGLESPAGAPEIELPTRRTAMSSAIDSTDSSPAGAHTAGPTAAAGGIWAAINSGDATAMIRFMVDVLGFEEQLVVLGEHGTVEHSQLVWPEGGTVQVASANRPGNVFSRRPVGAASLYVITADPMAVHRRCVDAGVEMLRAPESPEYDPHGTVFTIADHEGNVWSFGTYAGGS